MTTYNVDGETIVNFEDDMDIEHVNGTSREEVENAAAMEQGLREHPPEKAPVRKGSPEAKAAVKRVRDGESGAAVARELGINVQTLYNWVKGEKKEKVTKKTPPVALKAVLPGDAIRDDNERLRQEVSSLKNTLADAYEFIARRVMNGEI